METTKTPLSTSSFERREVFVFLKRLTFFGLFAVLGIIATLFFTGFLCRDGRLGTTYIKHQRLETLTSPKVVLIGGSNLHYGINTKMLEDSLEIPVVNMGIQQSIGLTYMFNEVKDELNAGDILLISIEPPSYIGTPLEGSTNIARIVFIYPKGIRHLNTKQYYTAAKYIGSALKQNFRDIEKNVFRKLKNQPSFYDHCDEWGDYHGHKGLAAAYQYNIRKQDYSDETDERIGQNGALEMIKTIRTQTDEMDVNLLIGFTPRAEANAHVAFFNTLQSHLPADIVLGNIADYIFPDSFFYDTPDHLIYTKRDMRTKMLLNDLRAYRNRETK